jgi:hypothetical protein
MPAIGHLHGFRRTVACAGGVRAGPVPADDLGARMITQPGGERLGLPVGQQVNRAAGVHVDQHGPVNVPAAQREIIHPQDRHLPGPGVGQGTDQPQHAAAAGHRAQHTGQPRPGTAGQRQRDRRQHRRQRRAAPRIP